MLPCARAAAPCPGERAAWKESVHIAPAMLENTKGQEDDSTEHLKRIDLEAIKNETPLA